MAVTWFPDEVHLEGLMHENECLRLANYAADVEAGQAIIEIGSYRGMSSTWMAAGALRGNRARVTCIDPWPLPRDGEPDLAHAERQRGALPEFLRVQDELDWPVTALRSHASTVAGIWLQPVGMLFHDADHSFLAVASDLNAWMPHLAPFAVVALHDYLGDEMEPTEVARFVEEILIPAGCVKLELTEKLWIGRWHG